MAAEASPAVPIILRLELVILYTHHDTLAVLTTRGYNFEGLRYPMFEVFQKSPTSEARGNSSPSFGFYSTRKIVFARPDPEL